MILVAIFSVILLQNVNCDIIPTSEGPLVETNVGSIRGVRSDDDSYNMFMGIPFAFVNESNVFGSAISYPQFEEVFVANNDSAICPQVEEFEFQTVGSLDCLHLNVYVPDSATPQNRLPVMVYIYGGGFVIGFGGRFLYGPEYLIRHDVILVTINYRLGPYGFMCLDIPEVPGNQGLKDQVIALRWIKNNIQSFNGDPNKITLFGNSAGAMSNGYHLISETEKLFTNLIFQSGNAFMAPPSTPNRRLPQDIAGALGYSTNDVIEALNFLSIQNPHSVINAGRQFSTGVCLENAFPGVDRFMSEYAINSNHSKIEGVPILLGYNSEESLALFHNPGNSEVWDSWSQMFYGRLMSSFNFDESKLLELGAIARRHYIGDEEVNDDVREGIMFFGGDTMFVYPIIRSIAPFLEANSGNIYQYLFSYDGGRNFVKIKDGITLPGVAHADEIGYLFKMEYIPAEPSPADQLIIDRMTTMWSNFAKYDDPTPEITELLPVKWKPITKGSPYHYVDVNTEMSAQKRYAPQRMSFWDLFYKAYREHEWTYIGQDEEDVPDSASSIGLSAMLGLFVVMEVFTSL